MMRGPATGVGAACNKRGKAMIAARIKEFRRMRLLDGVSGCAICSAVEIDLNHIEECLVVMSNWFDACTIVLACDFSRAGGGSGFKEAEGGSPRRRPLTNSSPRWLPVSSALSDRGS